MKFLYSLPSKPLIHVLGLLAMLIVMVVGVLTFATPQVSETITTQRERNMAEQSNALLSAQLTTLQEAEGRVDEIDAELEKLRAEISADESLDSVFAEIVQAATAANAQLQEVQAGLAEPWSAPTSDDALALITREPVDSMGATVTAPAPAATEGASPEAEALPDTAADAATGAEPPTGTAPEAPASSDQKQRVPFTLEAKVANMAAATQFTEALANATRLLGIRSVTVEPVGPSFDEFTITVQMDAFVLPGEK